MNTTPATKPDPSFPLFPCANGQWSKKVAGRRYYFGTWKDDPKGERALQDWLSRKQAIEAGVDGLRVSATPGEITVRELLARFLADSRTRMKAGDLAPRTYAGHAKELPAFASRVMDARVSALRPEHFSRYNEILVNERKLGRHARKRTIAYIKSMLNWGASVMASISDSSKLLMRQATSELGLNGRATDRIMRIARTIADMDGSENVAELHLAEAIQYRLLDRKHWG